MSTNVLTEELGPRAQRRVEIATAISLVALLAFVGFALYRFQINGQLDWAKWEDYFGSEAWQALWRGIKGTLWAAGLALPLAVVHGLAFALLRLSRSAPIRWLARAWVEWWRGVPVLVLILFSFFGLPQLGIDTSPYSALVIALTLYNGAILAEIFRAGILSLPAGQKEAASAIGLTYWQAHFYVILPQALRRMIPATVAQSATLLKDTALGFVIAYEEVLRVSRQLGEFYGNLLQSLVVVAVIYIVLVSMLSRLARRLEVQQRKKLGAGALKIAGGPEDLDGLAEGADEVQAEEHAAEVQEAEGTR